MELLKQRIMQDGIAMGDSVLKVDSFLNHQIDVALFNEMGKEFKRRFADANITKILTVEASGIAVACIAAQYFGNVPVVFAKKQEASNLSADVYASNVFSFTKNRNYTVRVDKKYLSATDRVLIIDDFLANGNAALGLIDLVQQSGGTVAGIGIVIEKGFQTGRKLLEEKGYRVESLAIVQEIHDGTVILAD
ncbi:MAG: xanthine phosphoribosyltransferase [Peptococcaceae bacterium]